MKVIGAISKKTKLPQTTWRRTGKEYMGRITEARGRFLVIGLAPGDLLMIRPLGLGRQRTIYVPLALAFEIGYWSKIKAERMMKLNAAKRRRK